MNDENYVKDVTTVLYGIRWVVFLCAFESARRWPADDAFLDPLYFASVQNAICNDDSCKWPSDLSNNVVQHRVLVWLSHCLPSAAELPGQHAYMTQWDYESMRNTSRSWLAPRKPLQARFFSGTIGSVLHCCPLRSARNRNSVVCHYDLHCPR